MSIIAGRSLETIPPGFPAALGEQPEVEVAREGRVRRPVKPLERLADCVSLLALLAPGRPALSSDYIPMIFTFQLSFTTDSEDREV